MSASFFHACPEQAESTSIDQLHAAVSVACVSEDGIGLASSIQGLFRFQKNFAQYLSHQILWHMYEVLNVDEKKLITQLSGKSRDETFEAN